MATGLVLGIGAALSGYLYVFMVLFTLAEYFMFLCITPIAMIILSCVPKHLRGMANALNTFINSAMGPALAPIIVGILFDAFGLYIGMAINAAWLIWSVLFWLLAWNSAVIIS